MIQKSVASGISMVLNLLEGSDPAKEDATAEMVAGLLYGQVKTSLKGNYEENKAAVEAVAQLVSDPRALRFVGLVATKVIAKVKAQ